MKVGIERERMLLFRNGKSYSSVTLHSGIVFVSIIVFSLAICGCSSPEESYGTPQIVTKPGVIKKIEGYSYMNRPIESITLGSGRDVTLIIASIHGNEQAGTPLVYKLIDHLRLNRGLLNNRKVVIVPEANPDGVAANTRYNARKVDLNRNFPSSNRKNNTTNGLHGLSEPESRVLSKVIDTHKPDRIISIHQPLNCIDYDGPGLDIAERMAAQCHLEVKKLGGRAGSLGSYCGINLGIPIITVEFPRDCDNLSPEELWSKYGQMLMSGITYPF